MEFLRFLGHLTWGAYGIVGDVSTLFFILSYFVDGLEAFRPVLFITLVLGFVLSAFSIHIRKVATEALLSECQQSIRELRTQTKPNFIGHISGYAVGTSTTPNGHTLDVHLALSNAGAPSIAKQWAVYVRDPSKPSPTLLTTIRFLEGVTTWRDPLHPSRQLQLGDFIHEKAKTPIATGGLIEGHIISSLPPELLTLVNAGAAIIVTCEDVYGKEWTFETDLS